MPWDPWELTVLDIIGKRIEEEELDMLPQIVEQEVERNDRRQNIRQLRDESVANFACAAKDVANELLHIRDEINSNHAR